MKQSTLFSSVTSGNNCVTSSVAKSKSSFVSVDKENVAVKVDVGVSVAESGSSESDVDIVEKDSNIELKGDQTSDKVSQNGSKQVISYEDFLNDNSERRTFTSSRSNTKNTGEAVNLPKNVDVNEGMSSPTRSYSHKKSFDKGSNVTVNGNMSDRESSKQSMAYQDFLGMFKPASVSEVVVADEDKADPHEDNDLSPPIKKEPVKCKSITSFFKPISKDSVVSNLRKPKCPLTLTITAEVHAAQSSEVQESPQKRPRAKIEQDSANSCSKSKVSPAKANYGQSDEIVLISSSIDSSSSEMCMKKRKLETAGAKKSSNTGLKLKRKKISTDLTEEEKVMEREGQKSTSVSSSKVFSGSSQCTLSFGASGLLVNKEKLQQPLEPKSTGETLKESSDKLQLSNESQEEQIHSEHKKASNKKIKLKPATRVDCIDSKEKEQDLLVERREKVQQELVDTSSDESKDSYGSAYEKQPEVFTDSDASSTSVTRGRKSGRLRLRQTKAVKVKKKENVESSTKGTDVVDAEGISTPNLRRSSRIKHNAESAKIVEVIEVISDDCESAKKSSKKVTGVKDKAWKSGKSEEQSLDKSDASGSAKVQRKLAPIFTRLKQAQPEPVKPPPPPTPEELERLRVRREFLMSGVPEELKRAKAAQDLLTLPEYPPFPCPSHVCQWERSAIAGSDSEELKKRVIPELCFDDVCNVKLTWDGLGWSKLTSSNIDQHQGLLFQGFSSHPLFNRRQTDALIRELHAVDKTFPFREALDQFAAAPIEVTSIKESPVPTNEDDVIVVDDIPSSDNLDAIPGKSNPSSSGVLWVDQHPVNSKHLVGNSKSFTQLKDWLGQWQEELKKEAKKALRKGGKSSRDTKKKARDWSDDSDFTDSSDEDCGLCNTMLLTGPHGVGKTSAVYCLAKEMGFKVFEVNPTSLRSGKQLQLQLEEATQSHRVSHSGPSASGLVATPPVGTPKSKPAQETPKQSTKPAASKAFSAFFKTTNTTNPTIAKKSTEVKGRSDDAMEDKKKEGKKKRNANCESERKRGRRKKDEKAAKAETVEKGFDGQDVSVSSLNISSASVILFDEADVVLEEDKGFLSTVQHFMSSTKIPIVLTATNPAIHSELSPRHEHIILKRPSVKTVTSFLHTVCLSKGVRVNHNSLTNLVSMLKQDVRQCLLFIQFWCESGGGIIKLKSGPVLIENPPSCGSLDKRSNNATNLSGAGNVSASDNSNDSDFLSLRPARKRRRLVCLDDDSNDSSASHVSGPLGVVDRTTTTQEKGMGNDIGDESDAAMDLPVIHSDCMRSLVGGNIACGIYDLIGDYIKQPLLDINKFVDELNHVESGFPCNLLYNFVLHYCPLPIIDPLPVRLEFEAPKNKEMLVVKKRKRIMVGDWLDSDGASDEDNVPGGDSVSGKHVPDKIVPVGENCNATLIKNCETDENVAGNKNRESGDHTESRDGEKVEAFIHRNIDSGGVPTDSKSVILSQSDMEVNNFNTKMSAETSIADTKVEGIVKDKSISKDKKSPSSISKYLHVLSNFYENNSSVQSLYCASGVYNRKDDEQCIKPGYSDEEILKGDTEYEIHSNLSAEIRGCMELLSARTLVKSIAVCVNKAKDMGENEEHIDGSDEDVNCLPIGPQMPTVWTLERNKPAFANDTSTKNIASCVGSSGGMGSRQFLHLDYMPVLREMCRFEHQRQTANTKRRFNHYFDYIGLNLRDSTRISLASTYSIKRS